MIVLITGPLGVGKSGFATGLAVRRAEQHGAILASNISLTPPPTIPFVQLPTGPNGLDVDAILALRDSALGQEKACTSGRGGVPCRICKRKRGRRVVLVVDEMGIVMDNRFWADAPPTVKWFLKHSRKLGVDVYGTTHDLEEVDVTMRRLVTYSFVLKRVPSGGEDGDERMPWFLIASRYQGAKAGVRDYRLGWPSLRRWRRIWASWFDSDEIVEIPIEYMRRAQRRAANLGLEPATNGRKR